MLTVWADSSTVERLAYIQLVLGSNPSPPTFTSTYFLLVRSREASIKPPIAEPSAARPEQVTPYTTPI